MNTRTIIVWVGVLAALLVWASGRASATPPQATRSLADLAAARPLPRSGRVRLSPFKLDRQPTITVKLRGRSVALRSLEDYDDQVHFEVNGQRVEPEGLWRRLSGRRMESIAVQLLQQGLSSRDPRTRASIAAFLSHIGYGLAEQEAAGLTLRERPESASPRGKDTTTWADRDFFDAFMDSTR